MFVCLLFFVPLENFSLILRPHHCRRRAANFYLLCSALIAIEQWGFFSVQHPLWHGASVYDGQLRGSVTLKPIAERLAVELSLPVFTTYVCRGWDSKTQPFTCGANVLTHCAIFNRKKFVSIINLTRILIFDLINQIFNNVYTCSIVRRELLNFQNPFPFTDWLVNT